MTLHFRAIELGPDERAAIDSGPELDLFERALAIRRGLGDLEALAESLWQVGLVQQVLRRDSARAAPYFHEALELVEDLPDCDGWLRSEIHRHVGFDLLVRETDYVGALAQLRRSLEIRETLDEEGWCAGGLTALAAVARQAGRRNDAIEYARRAVALATNLGLRQRHVDAATSELRAAEEPPQLDAST